MTNVFRLIRAVFIAALLVPLAPVASIAGEREVAYLRSLAGNYLGSGKVKGTVEGVLGCQMKLALSGQKLNVAGNCGDTFTGSIAYDDRSRRWIYTTGGKSSVIRKSGNSLRVSTSERNRRGSADSTLTFSPGKISFKFDLRGPNRIRSSGTVNLRRR